MASLTNEVVYREPVCGLFSTDFDIYTDNGSSERRSARPAFQVMIQDILAGKIECVIVKGLSHLGRDHITVGYYLEIFFPSNRVRFVSINDQFDTIDGMTNQNKDVCPRGRYLSCHLSPSKSL